MLKKIALLTAALVFVAYQSWPLLTETPTYNDDQNNIYLLATRRGDPAFLANDYAYGNPDFLKFYTPLYLDTIRYLSAGLGSYDAAMITLHTVMLTLYLASMFILLRYVSGSSWLALGVTLFSALARPAIASEVWGAAGMGLVYPRTAFLAVAPLLFWLTFRWLPKPEWWRLAVLGLLGGLSANLHPPSGLFFAQILITLVAAFACASLVELVWKSALVGVASLLGALPTFMPLLQNMGRAVAGQQTPRFEEFAAIVHERLLSVFPLPADQVMLPGGPLNQNWQVGLAIGGLVMGIVWVGAALWLKWKQVSARRLLIGSLLFVTLPLAYLVGIFAALDLVLVTLAYWVTRLVRQDEERLDLYALGVLACAAIYSYVGSVAMGWVWETFQVWSLTSFYGEQPRMSRLVYLPLFIFLTRWLALLLRQSRHEVLGVVISAGLVAGLVVRHWHFRDPWGAAEWGMGVSLLVLALAGVWACLKTDPSAGFGGVMLTITATATLYLWFYILGVSYFAVVALVFGLIGGLLYYLQLLSLRQWRWAVGLLVAVLFGWLFAGGEVAIANQTPLRVQAYKALGLYQYPEAGQQDLDRLQMYAWIRQNTLPESVFYFNDRQLEFRATTHRAVTHSWKDLGGGYYAPPLLLEYYHRFKGLEAAYQHPDDLLACATAYHADYIITKPDQPELPLPVVYANNSYRIYFYEQTTNAERQNCP